MTYLVMPGGHFLFNRTKKLFKEMDQDELKPNVTYHFGGSNKGFDLSCFPEAGDDAGRRVVAWNIETRFSTNDY
jgi:hypothetical protein